MIVAFSFGDDPHKYKTMPSLPNTNTVSPVIPQPRVFVQAKFNWGDNWEFVPFLYCDSVKRGMFPEGSSAVLSYDTGIIKQRGRNFFTQFEPQDIRDCFVRVLTQFPGSNPDCVFVGIVVEEELVYDRYDTLSGKEYFQCYGMEYLLQRNTISTSVAVQPIGEEEYPVTVDEPLPFNYRATKGHNLKGNRSTTPTDDGIHYFSADGELWANIDIIDYLLWEHTPEDFEFVLVGQLEPLEALENVYHFRNMTVWAALGKLIDRHQGLGFCVEVAQDDTILIRVVSLSDFEITVGDTTLPANNNPVSFTIPETNPDQHLVGDVPFRVTAAQQVSEIRVRGSLIKCVADFSFSYDNLTEGWEDSFEDEYVSAVDESDEDANDYFRQQDKFDEVFRKYIVPLEWEGTSDGQPILPTPQDDGTVEIEDEPEVFRFNKRFLRVLPFKKGIDYSVSPPEDNNPENVEPSFHAMACYYFDDVDGELHTKDDKFHKLEDLDVSNEDLKGCSFGPLDNDFGFVVHSSPNHYVANNDGWDGAAATKTEPELDYTKFLFVAMFDTDKRQQIVLRADSDNGRKLVVDVDAARYIYAAPQTCVGLDQDGQRLEIHADNEVLEDDQELLEAVASQVLAWYGRKRQAIEIPIRQIGYFVDLGAMLTSVNFFQVQEPINTPITSIECDFLRGETIVKTSYSELDFVSLTPKAEDWDAGELI